MNDTCFGINNEGGLSFDYYHEDTDQVDGANVYNGQLSTLWVNFRQAFPDKIKETYQDLRSNSVLNYDEIVDQFINKGSNKWSESVYNEDGDFKYISMLRNNNDATNLPQVRGTGEEHLRYFLENRFNYCDSKWYAGEYISKYDPVTGDIVNNFVTLRIYTPVDESGNPRTDLVIPASADITITPYSHMYGGVRYKANGTLIQERLEANETYTFDAPNEVFNDTETAIYGAPQLSSLGDLAPLYLGYIDVGAATKLVELKIGDGTPGYQNNNLYHLAVGTNRLLKKIDIQNCAGFNQALVLTGCPNIEEVYAKGSSITGVELPDSGYLKVLQLPATITNLTLKNQLYIDDLTIEGYENLKTITIENCPVVNSLDILDKSVNVERVRLTNVDWHYDDASILYELIDRDIAGIDENGVNTDTMWIDGKCHIETLTGNEFAEIKSLYPYLDITYTTLISKLTYMSEDGQTELRRETIYNGGNGTDPVENGTIETPTKESTPQYDYTFGGWSLTPNSEPNPNALKNVEADRIVYVAFNKTLRNYTVRFMNGSTMETSKFVAYGTNASPCKKNLFNSKAFVGNGVTNNSLGSITLSSYISFFNNMLDVACLNLAVGETYVWSGNNLNDIYFGGVVLKPNVPFVLTEEMLEKNTLGFYALKSTSSSSLYTITNMQLELGDTPTVYEAYSIITPVNNSTGNIEDFEFTGWKPEPINIQGDTDCYAQWYDTREITDDWATIAAACIDGTATSKYAIGTYKPVTIVKTKLPYDFYDGSAVVLNNEIHILGGAESMRNHYKFNGEEWVSVSTLPYNFYWSSAIVYNDEIHILGTYAGGNDNKHYKYNDTDGWIEVGTLPVYFKRGHVVVYNNEIHMIGGLGNATHYKYNSTDGWTNVHTFDSALYDGAGVVFDNKIHIFGGTTYNKHGVYDGNEWVFLDDLPYEMIRGQVIVYQDNIHILGSDYSSGTGTTHYKLNVSGEYIKDINLPYICSRFSTVVYNDKIHILGDYSQNYRNSHYLLNDSEWIPNGEHEIIDMEVIAHNHDELADGVNKWELVSTSARVTSANPVIYKGCIYTGNGIYDGNTWSSMPTPPIGLVSSMVVFNDEIHLLGVNTDKTAHYKFDGASWIEVGKLPCITSNPYCAVVYNNAIHLLSRDTYAVHYTYDGTSWTNLGTTLTWQGGSVVHNNAIYTVETTNRTLQKFDGASWIEVTELPDNCGVDEILSYKNELYFFKYKDYKNNYKWNETDGWVNIGDAVYRNSTNGYAYNFIVYNDEIHELITNGKHYKWSTPRWEKCTLSINDNVSNYVGVDYCDFDNSIYHCLERNGEYKLYKYDGESTIYITSLPSIASDYKINDSIFVYDNHLCFAIYDNITDSSNPCINLYELSDGVFSKKSNINVALTETVYLEVYKDNIHFISRDRHLIWDGSEIINQDIKCPFWGAAKHYEFNNCLYSLGNSANVLAKYDGETYTTIVQNTGINTNGSVSYTTYGNKLHMFIGRKHIVVDVNDNYTIIDESNSQAGAGIRNGSFSGVISGHLYVGGGGNTTSGNVYKYVNPRATLTFFAKNALKEKLAMNPIASNTTGWNGTNARKYLNNTVLNKLSTVLQSEIKSVAKLSDGGYHNKSIIKTDDKLWFASYDEVGFDTDINAVSGQGEPYPVFTDSNSRIRDSQTYYLRTTHYKNHWSFWTVNSKGHSDIYSQQNVEKIIGSVFGFCV